MRFSTSYLILTHQEIYGGLQIGENNRILQARASLALPAPLALLVIALLSPLNGYHSGFHHQLITKSPPRQ